MERRDFLKLCAAGAATAGAPALAADVRPQLYSRTLLTDEKGVPLRASGIPVERNLIFHYPFAQPAIRMARRRRRGSLDRRLLRDLRPQAHLPDA